MKRMRTRSNHGFSLVEVLVAMAVGLVVVGAAVQLFSKGLDATYLVSQRAQMQQDIRGAENLMIKDISLAGAGMPVGGVALPTGTAKATTYGCDPGACYIGSGAGSAYPGQYMYAIIPGKGLGPTLNAGQGPTDVITVVYADTAFLLNQYLVTFNAGTNGQVTTFTMPIPVPVPAPQPVNSASVGLQPGDLVLFTNTLGAASGTAIGEVTATAGGGPYTVTLADPDRLGFNQIAATGGNLKAISGGASTTATRIWVTTYYLDVLPDPSGAGVGTPRLMRQVNGLPPAPIADNVADLRFTYDTYDTVGTVRAGLDDAGASLGLSPNMIRKVNLTLSARSPMRGKGGYQSLGIRTSISARNLSFSNRYQ